MTNHVDVVLSPACLVCGSLAELRFRYEDCLQKAGVGTPFCFIQCTKCGIRSRELLVTEENRKTLVSEWTKH